VLYSQYDAEHARIALAGRLDSSTFSEAWAAAIEPVARQLPAQLIIDISGLTYCDDAGVRLFAELRRLITAGNGEIKFDGVHPDQQRYTEI
jgi:anti-anti-sigma factor